MAIETTQHQLHRQQERAPGVTWKRLLVLTGAAHVGVLVVVGIALGDPEPFVLTVIGLVGLLLLMPKRRWLRVIGSVLLGLWFVNTALFMAPALVSNLAGNGSGLGVMISGALTVIGVTGLVVDIAYDTREMTTGTTQAAARTAVLAGGLIAVVAVAVLAVAAVDGWSGAEPEATTAEEGFALTPIDVRADKVKFSDTRFVVSAGQASVTFTNGDLFWHTFTVDELGINLRVPVGGAQTATVDLPPGQYRFYCAIPGHAAAGMEGELIVSG